MFTNIFVFVNIFAKIQSLREIIGILNIFARMLTKMFVFVNTSAKLSRIRAIYVFQTLSFPGCPVQVTYQADLSSTTCFWLSCPSCPVPNVPSKMSWPDLSVLSWLSCPAVLLQLPCPGHLVHCPPNATFMSWQSCYLCTFQTDLSRLTYRADLLRLSCPDCPVTSFLS
jgi:hypothetical protein